MRIEMTVTDQMNKWDEYYTIPNDTDPQVWATDTIQSYNDTLRPGELPRALLSVRVIDKQDQTGLAHEWHKTNLITKISKGGSPYDTYECIYCKITAKRFGLMAIVRDQKYRSKKYDTCNRQPQ